MASQLQLRRGTTAQHATFIGAPAEATVDVNKKTLVVHDGTTVGGFPVLSASGGTMTGPVSMGGSKITSLATPTAPTDAAPKGYVDGLVAAATLADADYGDITVSGATTVWTIDDDAVTTAKIASGSVTDAKIASDAVTTAKILNANVTTAKIADSNVTTAKIADSNVTTAKIDDDAVTTAKIDDAAVTTAKIDDDAVTTAKIADGAVTPAKLSRPYTLATPVESTSGTSIDFTGIPSWAKRITVVLNGVSTSGTSRLQIQMGNSTGIKTTDYFSQASGAGGSVNTISTGPVCNTGFIVDAYANASGQFKSGVVTLTKYSSSGYASFGIAVDTSSTVGAMMCAGVGDVSNLDRIRVTTVNGTDTFDNGNINISYEG